MRVLRLKPWNPQKRQLVKTWVYQSIHYKAGIDVGFPGETPSPLYTFEDDDDPVIEYLLNVRHHNEPSVLSFEEIPVGKKDKDLKNILQEDLEERVSAGGKQARAQVNKVEGPESTEKKPKKKTQPKRRKRPAKTPGRKRPGKRTTSVEK